MSLAVTLPRTNTTHNPSVSTLRCPRCGERLARTASTSTTTTTSWEGHNGLGSGVETEDATSTSASAAAAQRRIVDLEGQIKILTGKAAAAGKYLYDKEDERDET